eukprot:1862061-Pleurochrysis_carterae.AAC.1
MMPTYEHGKAIRPSPQHRALRLRDVKGRHRAAPAGGAGAGGPGGRARYSQGRGLWLSQK